MRLAIVLRNPEAHGTRWKELAYEHRSHALIRFVPTRGDAVSGSSWAEFERSAAEFGAAGRRRLIGSDGVAIGFLASVSPRGGLHVSPVFRSSAETRSTSALERTREGRGPPRDAHLRPARVPQRNDEEFQVAGSATEVADEPERAAVHAAIPSRRSSARIDLPSRRRARVLGVLGERGSPDTKPIARRWPAREGSP